MRLHIMMQLTVWKYILFTIIILTASIKGKQSEAVI